VAVEASEPGVAYIWIHDIERGTKTRFTFSKAYETRPVWIFGRDTVAYSVGSGGKSPGWIKSADGSGKPVELGITEPRSCSRDGKYVFGVVDGNETRDDISYLPLDGDASPVTFLNGPASEGYPSISPDGKLLAYESDESGSDQVFLTQFPSGEGKWQVSVSSASQPRWSGTGEELFYYDFSFGRMMAVSVKTDPAVQLGTPVKLFDTRAAGLSPIAGFDVAPDGQRFLMIQVTDPDAGEAAIAIYENWFAEFKGRP
jgi:serine/threonine-protein kinase